MLYNWFAKNCDRIFDSCFTFAMQGASLIWLALGGNIDRHCFALQGPYKFSMNQLRVPDLGIFYSKVSFHFLMFLIPIRIANSAKKTKFFLKKLISQPVAPNQHFIENV